MVSFKEAFMPDLSPNAIALSKPLDAEVIQRIGPEQTDSGPDGVQT